MNQNATSMPCVSASISCHNGVRQSSNAGSHRRSCARHRLSASKIKMPAVRSRCKVILLRPNFELLYFTMIAKRRLRKQAVKKTQFCWPAVFMIPETSRESSPILILSPANERPRSTYIFHLSTRAFSGNCRTYSRSGALGASMREGLSALNRASVSAEPCC